MPTERQIAAELKKEQNERKRGIINQVTSAALHIIHNSQLSATTLWPKHGVQAHSMAMFEKDDIIDVQVFVHYKENGTTDELMRINLINVNKKYARMEKQANQLQLILDQSIFDDVFFEYKNRHTIGVGFYNEWLTMAFNFTIN